MHPEISKLYEEYSSLNIPGKIDNIERILANLPASSKDIELQLLKNRDGKLAKKSVELHEGYKNANQREKSKTQEKKSLPATEENIENVKNELASSSIESEEKEPQNNTPTKTPYPEYDDNLEPATSSSLENEEQSLNSLPSTFQTAEPTEDDFINSYVMEYEKSLLNVIKNQSDPGQQPTSSNLSKILLGVPVGLKQKSIDDEEQHLRKKIEEQKEYFEFTLQNLPENCPIMEKTTRKQLADLEKILEKLKLGSISKPSQEPTTSNSINEPIQNNLSVNIDDLSVEENFQRKKEEQARKNQEELEAVRRARAEQNEDAQEEIRARKKMLQSLKNFMASKK